MKNKSLLYRLMLAFILMSIILSAVGLISFYFEKKIVSNYEHIVNVNLPNAVLFGDMNQEISKVQSHMFELSLGIYSKEEAKELKEGILLSIEHFEANKNTYESVKSTVAGEEEVYAPIKESWPKLKTLMQTNLEYISDLNEENLNKFKQSYKTELGPLYKDFTDNLGFVLDLQKAASSENVENANSATTESMYYIISFIVFGVIFALLYGLVFSRNLSREMLLLADKLKLAVDSILNESLSVSKSSASLSSSVDAEAAALQETSSSTEELSAMVKRNEENAEGSKIISEESMKTSMDGKNAVSDMINAIDEISDSNKDILNSVLHTNENINKISQSIREIGDKTKIINDIVFQTKLLSFNASVEAARAGESGKGFAVVAEEVGNLAAMSGNAAKEISEMLDQSIKNVELIIEKSRSEVEGLVESSKSKLENGMVVANNCQKVLDDVVSNATRVNDLMAEISHASKEQTLGIAEISKAITQLDTNTAINNQTAKSSEYSSRKLEEEAKKLDELVLTITKTVKGA